MNSISVISSQTKVSKYFTALIDGPPVASFCLCDHRWEVWISNAGLASSERRDSPRGGKPWTAGVQLVGMLLSCCCRMQRRHEIFMDNWNLWRLMCIRFAGEPPNGFDSQQLPEAVCLAEAYRGADLIPSCWLITWSLHSHFVTVKPAVLFCLQRAVLLHAPEDLQFNFTIIYCKLYQLGNA